MIAYLVVGSTNGRECSSVSSNGYHSRGVHGECVCFVLNKFLFVHSVLHNLTIFIIDYILTVRRQTGYITYLLDHWIDIIFNEDSLFVEAGTCRD